MTTCVNSTTTAHRINALIAAADAARLLSWHGVSADREAHKAEADALIEQMRRVAVDWSRGRNTL